MAELDLGMVGRGNSHLLSPMGDGFCGVQLMGALLPALRSIALDPLYPSRCSWETFGYATSTSMAQASDGLSPLQLSGQLNSLPCSLTFRQEETISIIRLIEQVGAQVGGGAGPAQRGLSRLQGKLSQAGWLTAPFLVGASGHLALG